MEEFITKESLLDYGVDLTGKDVDSLLAELNATLEERVGSEITDSLDETQLSALATLQEKATDEEIGEWLSKNVPEFEQIVQDEIDTLLDELTDDTESVDKAV